MEKHREELLMKYIGEENFDFLMNKVSEFQKYLEGRMEEIYLQKTENLITSKQADKLINTLFQELERFFTYDFPGFITDLRIDLSFLDTEKISHEFCDSLYVFFNNTYLEKFRKK
jgi:hypothetical protein